MSVVPSIIVLVITALLVFRGELTRPTAGAKRHHAHRAKPVPRAAARPAPRNAPWPRRLEEAGQGLPGPH